MSESNENSNIGEENKNQTELEIEKGIVYSGDKDRSIKKEMEVCYLDYAMSVIVNRALPDIRDGFKPVHRRILYSMHEQGLRASSKYRKSATVVGHVLGSYHPHGDSSVYGAMVRMAQDFSLRYPLVNGQGNFGSMDGDNPAAYRYTEAKMTKLAEYMLSDIEKETVDFRDNFDTTKQEPTVMPTRIPNLLMNGVVGIAVGMATNIPPHNLVELIDAIQFLLKVEGEEDITVEDLMQYVKGPDFPTGGIVYDKEALLTAYSTGRGSVIVRGRADIEQDKKGRNIIRISEIPFQLNKSSLVEKIGELVRDKKIVGISALRDESNKDGVRIIIEMKKDAFPKKILNQLYKLTQLQTSFGYNMIALGDRGTQPKLFNLKEVLEDFIVHRKEVVERRTKYELKIAEARAHILEGLKKALDHINEIIKIIKGSETKENARDNLIEKFEFSTLQADAILEMKLSKLAGLERKKIEDELNEKLILISDLKDILAKPERIVSIIIEELDYIKETFGDNRKTEVNLGKVGEFNPKDTIPNEEVMILFTKNSYIKRLKASSFRTQRRGGKGVSTGTKENDEVKLIIPTSNHNDLFFFTSKGRVFTMPSYEIPETTRIAKGQPIINLLGLQKDEEISAILDITKEKNKYLFFVSKFGIVKKLAMSDIKNIRTNGLKVVGVKEGDSLMWVKTTTGEDNIFIATKEGKAIQFSEKDVRPMGRAASGVRGIKLKEDDKVIEVAIVGKDNKFVLIVTEKGMGKVSSIEEYRNQKRGGTGVKAMAVTKKTGKLISAKMLREEDRKESDIILISKLGQTIRIPLKGIRNTSRVTQGVILTKIKTLGDEFVRASIVAEEEIEE
ncbi:DNA gyrase subunit A [Candidatus Gracilibacteria bacterium]|nr:MAG: DNA gyrase subunit A [Candidatus Gracilibacteria bacterium]PIE85725.1 MAG: DNA gyrase subunit A [Candidatus Gracilibacteria bacterium]